MAGTLSEAEIEELARLLRRLSESGQGAPRLPAPVFYALKGVVAQPVVELLLRRDGAVLLTYREDANWRGWHLPGGFVGVGESLEAACSRLAKAELGIDVRLEGILGHMSWDDHPYASPVSLLCSCAFEREPSSGEFFASPPEPMIERHRELLRAVGW